MSKLTERLDNRVAVNAGVLATVTVVAHIIAGMQARMVKPWPKQAGDKPTDAMLMAAALFSKRGLTGGAGDEAAFVAMQLRPEGCSITQHGVAFNCGPARNHTRALTEGLHYFVRSGGGKTPYCLTFTEKGERQLAAMLASVASTQAAGSTGDAKPAKAKRKAKAKPAPVAAGDAVPTSDAPQGATGDAGEATAPVTGDVAPAGDAATPQA